MAVDCAIIIRRLRKERLDWLQSGDANELKWAARGLEDAIRIVREIAHEERKRPVERKFLAPPRLAGKLAHAVQVAINDLRHGKKPRAMAVLMKARELVEG